VVFGENSLLSPCQTLITRIDSGVLLVEDSDINPTTPPSIARPQLKGDLDRRRFRRVVAAAKKGRVFSRLFK